MYMFLSSSSVPDGARIFKLLVAEVKYMIL